MGAVSSNADGQIKTSADSIHIDGDLGEAERVLEGSGLRNAEWRGSSNSCREGAVHVGQRLSSIEVDRKLGVGRLLECGNLK